MTSRARIPSEGIDSLGIPGGRLTAFSTVPAPVC
jgi:hypothetical protein